MLNIRYIINFLGRLLMIESVFLLVPLIISLIYQDGQWIYFVFSAFIALISGALLWYPFRNSSRVIEKREGFLLVSLVWLFFSFFGALPYLFGHHAQSFTDAFFETMSGFTTTGASIFIDVESLPKSILFWRSFTHFIGGMGILVLTVAILPALGAGAIHLYSAETSGLTINKIKPRTIEVARTLWGIYIGLIVLEIILLKLGGMNLFDSVCHSFGTIATGGFSTKNDSIAGYSPYIQYVVATFMLLSGMNFTLYFFLLKGDLKKIAGNHELILYLGVILISVIFVTFLLNFGNGNGLESSFRSSFFQVSSIVTCTGFATDDYMAWGNQLWIVIFFLMFAGGSAGSTSGGIKMVRHLLMLKNIRTMFHKLVHPIGWLYPVRLDKKVVTSDILIKVFAFFMLYLGTWAFGTLFLSLAGVDMMSAAGASAATLGGIGPGLGIVGPAGNYAAIPDTGKWILSFLMLLGRLELYSVYVLFTGGFWRND